MSETTPTRVYRANPTMRLPSRGMFSQFRHSNYQPAIVSFGSAVRMRIGELQNRETVLVAFPAANRCTLGNAPGSRMTAENPADTPPAEVPAPPANGARFLGDERTF